MRTVHVHSTYCTCSVMATKLLTSLAVLVYIDIFISSSAIDTQSSILCVDTLENAAVGNCSSITEFKCKSCQELSHYVNNVDKYFTSNTIVVFTSGRHCLEWPQGRNEDKVVNVTRISNFSMIGHGAVSLSSDPLDEGTPQPSSTISCRCSQEGWSGLLFYKSNSILIENLTIEDCGVNFTLQHPDNFTMVSALAFRESYDIDIAQLRMNQNRGFALQADRNYGRMSVTNSAFLRPQQVHVHPGGNARFWYSQVNTSHRFNTTLHVADSWFLHGKSKFDKGITSAAGLTILIYLPNVTVTIDRIRAMYNIGNVAFLIRDYEYSSSSITMSRSLIAHGSAMRGAGLRILLMINRNTDRFHQQTVTNIHRDIISVFNTTFANNSAGEMGGGAYISHYEGIIASLIRRYINFLECAFNGNSISHRGRSYAGAAMQVIKHRIDEQIPHTSPQFFLNFTRCSFMRNRLNEVINEGGILDIISTNGIIIIDSNFTSNNGTAISLRESNVEFIGNITFKHNRGINGGALRFCQFSTMYLQIFHLIHNKIEFINNSAKSMGGAIYVAQEQCVETSPPCFFQPTIPSNVHLIDDILERMNLTLMFENNTAGLAGDAVYGGQIDYCYLIVRQNHTIHGHPYLSHVVFGELFNITSQHDSSMSTVSSTPYGVCFCNTSNGTMDSLRCNNMTYPLVVSPGQMVSIGVTAIGQRNGTVPISPVYFEFGNPDDGRDNSTQLVVDSYQVNQPLAEDRCNMLQRRIFSNRMAVKFNITIRQVSPKQQRYTKYTPPYLEILINNNCPWAFSLRTLPPYKCVCDDLLGYPFTCDVDSANVTRPGGQFYWLGCSSGSNNNATEEQLDCEGVSLSDRCPMYYCKSEAVNVSLETLDYQCGTGREGVLCGRCKQNYSLALGTSRCLPSCSNYMAFVVLAVFAASGVLLVVFLIACNITVSDGTINGLLFYAHIVHRNSQYFFPGSAGLSNSNIFRLFIAWLNLDFGIEVCFYKSLTHYQKTWLQFGFLFYLWILELIIIILSRRYIFFTRLVGRNIVKVLATMFLICYTKTISIAINSLEFANIKHSDRSQTSVWLLDGNIDYLSGKHIPLFLLGIILIFISLAYTLILLFIQCLQRRSNIYCLRWVNKLRPFFEAYTGPCQINYRFWPGFLFFVRLTLYTFSSILRGRPVIILNTTTAACIIILIFAFVSPHGVYKQWPLNVLESVFIINLGMLSGLVTLFCHPRTAGGNTLYFVYPSITIVMVLFTCILSYRCIKLLFMNRHCRRLTDVIITTRRKLKDIAVQPFAHRHRERDELEPLLNSALPQVNHYDCYREPLISGD